MEYKPEGREFKPRVSTDNNLSFVKLGYGVGMVSSGGGKIEHYRGLNTRIREGRLVGKREEEFFIT